MSSWKIKKNTRPLKFSYFEKPIVQTSRPDPRLGYERILEKLKNLNVLRLMLSSVAISIKGNDFCSFLSASLSNETFPKRGLLFMEFASRVANSFL